MTRSALHHRATRPPHPELARPQPAARAIPAAPVARTGAMHDISTVPIGETVQRKTAPGTYGQAYRAPNRTGLPDRLKAGVEALAGRSMDDVRVHFSSPEPSKINAHAFTRGTDIHVAPGQERHLPHEAWHVVQQAEARVRPTTTVAGIDVNDDAELEREADARGAASAALGTNLSAGNASNGTAKPGLDPARHNPAQACVQRVIAITDGSMEGTYRLPYAKSTADLIAKVKTEIGDELASGWVGSIREEVKVSKSVSYTTDSFLDKLRGDFPKIDKTSKIRPNFPSSAYWLGAVTREIQTGEDQSDLKPAEENLALPHRFPYKAIEDSTQLFLSGQEGPDDLDRWTGRLVDATKKRRVLNVPKIQPGEKRKRYDALVDDQLLKMEKARKKLHTEVEGGAKLDLTSPVTQDFLKYTNALHGNIPDFGPHAGVNIQVSNRTHLNVEEDGTLSPGSYAAGSMSPHRGRGVARTSDGKNIVTTAGKKVDPEELSKKLRALLETRGYSNTTIDAKDLDEY